MAERFVTMCLVNNVVMYPSKNAQTDRGNNVEVYLVNSVNRCHSRYVMPANLHTEEENRWRSNRNPRLSYSFRSVTKCNTTNTLSDNDLETLIVLILYIYLCQYYLWHSSQTDGIKY